MAHVKYKRVKLVHPDLPGRFIEIAPAAVPGRQAKGWVLETELGQHEEPSADIIETKPEEGIEDSEDIDNG